MKGWGLAVAQRLSLRRFRQRYMPRHVWRERVQLLRQERKRCQVRMEATHIVQHGHAGRGKKRLTNTRRKNVAALFEPGKQ